MSKFLPIFYLPDWKNHLRRAFTGVVLSDLSAPATVCRITDFPLFSRRNFRADLLIWECTSLKIRPVQGTQNDKPDSAHALTSMAWLINCSITTECRSSGMCVLNRSWGLVLWGAGGGGALILLPTFTPIFPGSGNLLSPGPNTPRFLERLSTMS